MSGAAAARTSGARPLGGLCETVSGCDGVQPMASRTGSGSGSSPYRRCRPDSLWPCLIRLPPCTRPTSPAPSSSCCRGQDGSVWSHSASTARVCCSAVLRPATKRRRRLCRGGTYRRSWCGSSVWPARRWTTSVSSGGPEHRPCRARTPNSVRIRRPSSLLISSMSSSSPADPSTVGASTLRAFRPSSTRTLLGYQSSSTSNETPGCHRQPTMTNDRSYRDPRNRP